MNCEYKDKDKIINRYTHSLLYSSQSEVFNRPSIEIHNYDVVIKNNRHNNIFDNEWIVWRFINNTQVYTNEYIGRDIQRFGEFNEL